MHEFNDNDVLELGEGVTVRAVGVSGRADDAKPARQAGVSARTAAPGAPGELLANAGAPADTAGRLGVAVTDSDMWVRTVIEFPEMVPPTVAGEQHLELEVDAPGLGEEQVVLEVDGDGFLRWHWPLPQATAAVSTRALPTQRFDIPVQPPTEAVRALVRQRSLIGQLIRKTLHVIRFPIEQAAGVAAKGIATWWESNHRKHRLRLVGIDGTIGPEVDTPWFTMADSRCLVLVHGTFSTGQASFAGLCGDAGFRAVHDLYAGRVLVFDHPTMHQSPRDNAIWLAKQLPGDRRVSLDLVTHSRGGLVAREISRVLPDGTVNRMVQVASPNAGTALCDPVRIGTLLDVTTNLAGFLPESPVSAVLEATLTLVKHLAIGGFHALPGLVAMDPNGDALANLNQAAEPGFPTHTIVTEYEPAASASLAAKALDVAVDAIFGAENDLVVPTASMSRGGTFVVTNPFHAIAGAGERSVAHSSYFGTSCVRAEVARCLALPAGELG